MSVFCLLMRLLRQPYEVPVLNLRASGITLAMEREKRVIDGGLPLLSFEPEPEHVAVRTCRRCFSFFAACGVAALLGWTAFGCAERQLKLALDSPPAHHGHHGLNPDARGKLTVKQAEELFL
jgi:hypothetical protein